MRLELTHAVCQAGPSAYSVAGDGDPLVLIHGVGMRQQVWAPQVRDLSARFKVITYDMLGHGNSEVPAEGVTLAHYCRQLLDLLDHLGIARAHVTGHSMGALIALEFALQHPDRCLRVAALNAVFCRTPEQAHAIAQRVERLKISGVGATLDATIERWFAPATGEDTKQIAWQVREFLRTVHPQGYRRSYALFAQSDRAHVDRLAHLSVPVFFMTGEDDANSQPSMSQAMAQRAPNSCFEVVSGARHMMTLTHADEVNSHLVKFLTKSSFSL